MAQSQLGTITRVILCYNWNRPPIVPGTEENIYYLKKFCTSTFHSNGRTLETKLDFFDLSVPKFSSCLGLLSTLSCTFVLCQKRSLHSILLSDSSCFLVNKRNIKWALAVLGAPCLSVIWVVFITEIQIKIQRSSGSGGLLTILKHSNNSQMFFYLIDLICLDGHSIGQINDNYLNLNSVKRS